jgi:3-hydroxyisobutyrate dehydrogenase
LKRRRAAEPRPRVRERCSCSSAVRRARWKGTAPCSKFWATGRIVHVGGHGAGYTAKLLVNLLWFGQAVATAEALLLGQRAGIDPAVLEHAIAGSSAASAFIRRDVGRVFQDDYLTSFGLDRICEELEAVTALAGDYQVPWELSDLVRRTYRRALARYGPVDGELLAVALLEEEAGRKLRPGNR